MYAGKGFRKSQPVGRLVRPTDVWFQYFESKDMKKKEVG